MKREEKREEEEKRETVGWGVEACCAPAEGRRRRMGSESAAETARTGQGVSEAFR